MVKVLGSQNLAFQGDKDQLYTVGNGNFLKFVELLALFDPLMKEHVRKVINKEIHVHYLGKNIQNELIQILANATRNQILEELIKAKYYSIILDCTPDCSHVEQMTIVVRYVKIPYFPQDSSSDVTDDRDESCVQIREHFLGFIPLEVTTEEGMKDVVLELMEDLKLRLDDLRGQGYDNGSNM